MTKSRPLIYATRRLENDMALALENAGLDYEARDFISVEHNFDPQSFKDRLNHSDTQARVFTSKNAVFSLQALLKDDHIEFLPKKNFTVGIKATEMLAELGIETSVRADNAISLAQIIARNDDVNAVDFFCGDKALDDLPEYLESKNVKVHRETVYHTELVHHEVETESIDGLLVLSPSAVFSFFKKNKLDEKVPVFCIGATTAEAVHLRCDNPRVLADEPTKESTVAKVIEYFSR